MSEGEGGTPGGFPFRVLLLDEVSSTNDEVKRALDDGEPEGLVVRALRQVAGYGRQGRAWTSPAGGLYCSLLLRPQVEPRELPTLSLVVGMAVRRALVALAGDAAAQSVRIKWPNDVVCERGKLCGISLEVHGGGVCVGVGVNVLSPDERPDVGVNVLSPDERPDVGGKNRAAYVADLAPVAPPSIETVLDAFLAAFSPLYDEWTRAGFAALVDEFNAHASLIGRTVSVVDRAGSTLAEGAVRRIDAQGRLVLLDASGTETPVSSGEAHLV